jgi:muramidase (phage lysozyme)
MGSSGYSANDHDGEDCSNPALIVRIPGAPGAAPSVSTSAVQSALAPLLDFIGSKESKGYDDISGLVSRSRHPTKKLTQMTIREVLDWQESIDQFQLSEAVGRYQIMEDTLRGYDNNRGAGSESNSLYVKAGLSSSSLFSPENQDKMATVLIQESGLNRFLSGEISRETFANKLANVWAALPIVSGPKAGKSAYEGDRAGNKTVTTIQQYLDVLDKVKAGYAVNNRSTR